MRKARLSSKALSAAIVLVGAVLSGMSAAETREAQMLLFQKSENGVDPYPSRLIVTADNMRLDDGIDGGDFALLDRKGRVVYSVAHEDGTVLEIPYRPVDVESPLELKLDEKKLATGDDAPSVAGEKPRHFRLFSGERVCYDVVAVPGLLEESVRAMREFREIMAGEHAATLPYIPADQQDACDLGMTIYRHGWLLEHGLPIQEWDPEGNGRILVNFDASFQVDSALFELPEGYRHYRITPEE